eukprot:SAG11_NODE_18860_length_479_cov_3.150000_1_plen_100_part_10
MLEADPPLGAHVVRAPTPYAQESVSLTPSLPPSHPSHVLSHHRAASSSPPPPPPPPPPPAVAWQRFDVMKCGAGWDAPRTAPWLEASAASASRAHYGKPA